MILLLSSSSDVNMDFVILWLRIFNHNYIRINADEILEGGFYVSVIDKELHIKEKVVELDRVNAVWFRKFGGFSKTQYYKNVRGKINHSDLQQISNENNSILNALVSMVKGKKWLTPPWLAHLNKMDILTLAMSCGLSIPKTYLVSNKQLITQKLKNTGNIITKSVYEPYFIQKENGFYSMFTKEIKLNDIENLPDTFFPSLIQEKIQKKYEIRVFYIDGHFYSMAIFSQQNKATELDFRKYDWEKPNRRVPYQMPKSLEEKIDRMLRKLKLNCCSIDIIKSSVDNEYYFLEINPTGEFGMVAIPCNYELYKKIALTLIKMDTADELQ